jgi:hypothetical protein
MALRPGLHVGLGWAPTNTSPNPLLTMHDMPGPLNRLVFGLLVALASHAAVAQDLAAHTGGRTCTDVEIDGKRVLAYDCLSALMKPTDSATTAVVVTGDTQSSMSNKQGLYNFSALKHRMGSNLGISVQPFRPKLSYPTPLASPTGK